MAGIKLTDKPVGTTPSGDDTKLLAIQRKSADGGGTIDVVRQLAFSQLRAWICNEMTGIKCKVVDYLDDSSILYYTNPGSCGMIVFLGDTEDSFGIYLVCVGTDSTVIDDITISKVFGPDSTKISVGSSYGNLIIGNHTGSTLHGCFINLTPEKGSFPNAQFAL